MREFFSVFYGFKFMAIYLFYLLYDFSDSKAESLSMFTELSESHIFMDSCKAKIKLNCAQNVRYLAQCVTLVGCVLYTAQPASDIGDQRQRVHGHEVRDEREGGDHCPPRQGQL